MHDVKWGGLRARVAGGPDGQGGGDGPVVVLLHGFGAPGDDLMPMAAELELDPRVRFVFPEGPLAFDLGMSFGESRAWWMIDMSRMASLLFAGRASELMRDVPEGMADARGQVIALFDEMERALNVRGEQVILGGFSQGAMLATDVALRTERPLAGLVLLSGMLLAEPEWTELAKKRRGLPVFQSHGAADPLLPLSVARPLTELLQKSGLELEHVEHGGGHEIPLPVLLRLRKFINRRLAA
jgi:phospholipase/carboxylesterase